MMQNTNGKTNDKITANTSGSNNGSRQSTGETNVVAAPSRDVRDVVVFVTNSYLDGFKEGDGDFMDKITIQLNESKVTAIRVVVNATDIPDDRKVMKRYSDDKSMVLALSGQPRCCTDIDVSTIEEDGSNRETFDEELQARFSALMDGFKEKHKIIYIGSRFDRVDYKNNRPIRKGSGSLFTKDYLKKLVDKGIKIVICCLEYKFFLRSMLELPKAVEMLRQQLFFADKIHFLTQHDCSNFKKAIDVLLKQRSEAMDKIFLPPHKLIMSGKGVQNFFGHALTLRLEWDKMNLKDDISQFKEELSMIHNKCIHIPGIYTITPHTKLNAGEIDNLIHERLYNKADKRNGILCFGMIRGGKGVEDAIDMALKLARDNSELKVYIVGSVSKGGDQYFLNILRRVFCDVNIDGGLRPEGNENKGIDNEILSFLKKENVNDTKELISMIEKKKQGERTETWRDIIKNLFEKYKRKCLEIHIDKSEDEITKIAQKCFCAIKLDNKGMADNASSIVSCIGQYLPVFTASGLVTGDEFRSNEHRIGGTSIKEFQSPYRQAVIMPKKEYCKLVCRKGAKVTVKTEAEVNGQKERKIDLYIGYRVMQGEGKKMFIELPREDDMEDQTNELRQYKNIILEDDDMSQAALIKVCEIAPKNWGVENLEEKAKDIFFSVDKYKPHLVGTFNVRDAQFFDVKHTVEKLINEVFQPLCTQEDCNVHNITGNHS